MEFTTEDKNRIETSIVNAIISSLKTNAIEELELSAVADFVLGRIDNVKTNIELLAFLSELSSKWQIFKQIEKIEQGKLKEQKEDEVARGVLDLAKTGKIDDAIKLAKTMTTSK